MGALGVQIPPGPPYIMKTLAIVPLLFLVGCEKQNIQPRKSYSPRYEIPNEHIRQRPDIGDLLKKKQENSDKLKIELALLQHVIRENSIAFNKAKRLRQDTAKDPRLTGSQRAALDEQCYQQMERALRYVSRAESHQKELQAHYDKTGEIKKFND